jgi:hypothetical protein
VPAGKRRWLYHGQGLAPVEPASEPDQGETGGGGGAPWLDVTFLIQRELFTQEEVFCRECRTGTQTEEQKAPSITHLGRQHAVDDNGVTIGDARHRPKAFVRLGKEGEAAKLIEELLLQGLKLLGFNRPAIVVIQRNKKVIFFHQSQLPQGLECWTPGLIR